MLIIPTLYLPSKYFKQYYTTNIYANLSALSKVSFFVKKQANDLFWNEDTSWESQYDKNGLIVLVFVLFAIISSSSFLCCAKNSVNAHISSSRLAKSKSRWEVGPQTLSNRKGNSLVGEIQQKKSASMNPAFRRRCAWRQLETCGNWDGNPMGEYPTIGISEHHTLVRFSIARTWIPNLCLNYSILPAIFICLGSGLVESSMAFADFNWHFALRKCLLLRNFTLPSFSQIQFGFEAKSTQPNKWKWNFQVLLFGHQRYSRVGPEIKPLLSSLTSGFFIIEYFIVFS